LVDPPSVAKPQMKTFTPEQARIFLEAIRGDQYEAVFATAIALGYRQGEALGLQWPDVNLENEQSSVTVRQSIQRIDGKLTITPTKKDKIHTVPLPAVTRSILLAHWAKQDQDRQARDRFRVHHFDRHADRCAQRHTPIPRDSENDACAAAHPVPRFASQRGNATARSGREREVHQ
jgi:integrase